MKSKFTEIYLKQQWKTSDGLSGAGSTIDATAEIRDQLPQLLKKYKIQTLVDIPCGDLAWISKITDQIENYIGGDIVEELVADAKAQYPELDIRCIDLLKDELPEGDALMVRDCLIHFSPESLEEFKRLIKESKYKYLLTSSFDKSKLKPIHLDLVNKEIEDGGMSLLCLEEEPHNFPQPLDKIEEQFIGKYLGIWEVSSL